MNMPNPEQLPQPAIPTRPRWIKAPQFPPDSLNGKRVFAQFTTSEGRSFEGVGEIRARHNNQEDLWLIDLVFQRFDTPYQITDMIFRASARQAANLKKAKADEGYDYYYEGHLAPDNSPDDEPRITIVNIQHSKIEGVMSVITTRFVGATQNMNISPERAEKLVGYIGETVTQAKFQELMTTPVDALE
jgi:hypothetical protein